jgi:O-antigen/teichoic acid export membrane protein
MSEDSNLNKLKKKSSTAVVWDLLGTYTQQGIGFVISIILARLLLPAEFGLVGMAMVFIGIFQVFTDFGFATALIQNRINTSVTYSSVFYLNLAAGIVLFILTFIGAPLLGRFYDNPEVTVLIRWLSLTFIFTSINIVQRTILKRNIDFKKLTIRNVISQVLSGIVGVILAFKGWGVYSLIAQNLLSHLVNTLILWKVSDWKPSFEFSMEEIKKLSGFSIFRFIDSSLSAISLRIDSLAIGKCFSADVLGYYTRAESLNALVVKNSSATVTRVFYSVLSKLNNSTDFLKWYRSILALVCLISFFLTGILYLLGEEIIIFLFGQKWYPAVPIFKILVLKAFTFPLNAYVTSASLSRGKSRETFNIGLFRNTFRLLPLVFAFYYGLEPFLISFIVVNYIITFFNVFYLSGPIGLPFFDHMKIILINIVPFLMLMLVVEYFNVLSYIASYPLAFAYMVLFIVYTFMFNRHAFIIAFKFLAILRK